MKLPLRGIALFSISCCVTAVIWRQSAPQQTTAVTLERLPAKPDRTPWTRLRLVGLLEQAEKAGTDPERMAAAVALAAVPDELRREALEATPLIRDRKLTFTARVLLIQWGAADGGASCRWAWERFRKEGVWDQAFREIGPSWAAKDPKGFAKWALSHKRGTALENITLKDALASDEPILDFSDLGRATKWLVSEDPQAAFHMLISDGGNSSDDYKLAEALGSVEQVHQALLAFDHLDEMTPGHYQGDQIIALGLLQRWYELDPEGFSRSSFARFFDSFGGNRPREKTTPDWQATLEQTASLPAEERQAAFARCHQAWFESHPDEQPDKTGWSVARLRAWSDLEALRGVDGE